MARNVSALFDSREQAAGALRSLHDNEFTDREITVLTKADEGEKEARSYDRSLQKEDATTASAAGGALGAAIGGALGLASMAIIPAVPLLMAGGALAGALAGRGLGGLGFAEQQVHNMENALRSGGVLVLVREETNERAELAKQLLERHRAASVSIAAS